MWQPYRQNVVVIGGGTGSFTVLSGLKHFTSNITALVSMADDGGSTGVLRDELGVLPPGDIRQCLVALSDDKTSPVLRDLFNYRFEEGSLAGHSFGNLFLSSLEKVTDDFDTAVKIAGELLHITGRVMPITRDNVRLALRWGEDIVRGEGNIDVMDFERHNGERPDLFLEPEAHINPEAAKAIMEATIIVIAPGDIYTSLGPFLVVKGVAQALADTAAKVVYVSNLVINPRQTKGFSVADHVAEIERFAGGPVVDYVLYNNAKPDPVAFERYSKVGETLVEMRKDECKGQHYEIIGHDLISRNAGQVRAGDKLADHRSLIRHNPIAVAEALVKIGLKQDLKSRVKL